MTKEELREQMLAQISDEEWNKLRAGDKSLRVSVYNRNTLLRLAEEPLTDPEGIVDQASAEELETSLRAYLDQYMAEAPEAHKWIILACLFSAFLSGEPMHPVEVVHAEKRIEDGETRWYCRAREDVPGCLCRWCVCRKQEDL